MDYSIEKRYNGLYDEIRKKIKELILERYDLQNYVLAEYKDQSPFKELKKAGQSLRGLIRIILFKRLESSVEAFKETIKNLINLNWLMIEAIKADFILSGEEAQKYMYQYESKEEEGFFSTLEELSTKYNINALDIDKLKDDIEFDIKILN